MVIFFYWLFSLQGVFSSRGQKILMADADGATKFADIEKVEEGLKNLRPWPVSINSHAFTSLQMHTLMHKIDFCSSLKIFWDPVEDVGVILKS